MKEFIHFFVIGFLIGAVLGVIALGFLVRSIQRDGAGRGLNL